MYNTIAHAAKDNHVGGFWTAQAPMYIPFWWPVVTIEKMALNKQLKGYPLFIFARTVTGSKPRWLEVWGCDDIDGMATVTW